MRRHQHSFEKFHYLLRPSKQVERKLLIETCHRLARANYRVSEYTYIGLGSVYFVDFVLLHRYLYIDDMICVEREAIPKRMKFNGAAGDPGFFVLAAQSTRIGALFNGQLTLITTANKSIGERSHPSKDGVI